MTDKPIWRLYYGDGTTYSDLDGPPELAPARNVQCVVQWEWGTRVIQREEPERMAVLQRGGLVDETRDRQGVDVSYKGYFCYNPDGEHLWYLTDAFGFLEYMASPGWKTVKFGRIIATPKFNDCIKRAIADPDFL